MASEIEAPRTLKREFATCSTCSWWIYPWTNEPPRPEMQLWPYATMQCRRRAPSSPRGPGDAVAMWPETRGDQGCGDYAQVLA